MIELYGENKAYYEDVLAVLKQLNVDTSKDILYETDSGNSILMRGRFSGLSVNLLVRYIANMQGKEIECLE